MYKVVVVILIVESYTVSMKTYSTDRPIQDLTVPYPLTYCTFQTFNPLVFWDILVHCLNYLPLDIFVLEKYNLNCNNIVLAYL